jgi:hypothetical protein
LRSAEQRLWRGLSHFDTLEAARAAARQTPALGPFIAEVVIPEDEDDIHVEQTGRAGHHTVWGSPARLLRYVERVVAVTE